MTIHHPSKITRRRCISIIGASLTTGVGLSSLSILAKANQNHLTKLTWQGIILGADASITLYTEKGETAKSLIAKMLKEVKRLEGYFSLYQEQSLLTKLNQNGMIKNPPAEFLELITQALHIASETEGRFDPTIQPLFLAYKALAKSKIPETQNWHHHPAVQKAKSLINWQGVHTTKDKIAFEKPDMALTLNGIAQGFITDHAAGILKTAGFENCLINFGEYRALGHKPNANGWKIQLGENHHKTHPHETPPSWILKNGAIAASSKSGMILNKETGLHHLLDPKTASNQPAWQDIFVQANTATKADACSTALFATTPQKVKQIFQKLKADKALLVKTDGTKINLIRHI